MSINGISGDGQGGYIGHIESKPQGDGTWVWWQGQRVKVIFTQDCIYFVKTRRITIVSAHLFGDVVTVWRRREANR